MVKPSTLAEVSPPREASHSAKYLRDLMPVLGQLPVSAIDEVVSHLLDAYQHSRTVYLFGNGGSAALASHAACDLGKGTTVPTQKPFRVVSLTDNMPLVSAWANDVGYEEIFAAQLRPFIAPGDIAFAISGSGNSPNVLNGLRASQEAGGFNIGLAGCGGGKMKVLCDRCITIASENMQHIEDAHLCVMHAVFVAFRQCLRDDQSSRSTS
jgi:D-sedoheptulose 7-phosphate isomerase